MVTRRHLVPGSSPTARVVAALAATVLLGGCDFIYGVTRDARLESQPALDCVGKVIRATPGIARVEEENRSGGRVLTWSGLQPPNQVYYFRYFGEPGSHVFGFVHLDVYPNGEVEFSNYRIGINRKPPQEDIDATRPVMQKIEAGLAKQCGLTQLPARIKELCTGVDCKPLAD